ncbi:hypothetical protein [Burkholderia sp. MSMB617WGS]|uniref:hypothetical protein n=1 Tax=Burkholderia sp. MSMB617WGS TaxID=1637831 RepID=UPI000ACEAFBD|nr:hypothetical protein [Burkholderia sp. MSMB617WGS]
MTQSPFNGRVVRQFRMRRITGFPAVLDKLIRSEKRQATGRGANARASAGGARSMNGAGWWIAPAAGCADIAADPVARSRPANGTALLRRIGRPILACMLVSWLCYFPSVSLAQAASGELADRRVNEFKYFNIDKIYGRAQKPDEIRSFHLTFEGSRNRVYSTELNEHLIASFVDGTATIVQQSRTTPKKMTVLYSNRLSDKTAFVSVAFELTPGHGAALQVVETDRNHNFVDGSPIYRLPSRAEDDPAASDASDQVRVTNRPQFGGPLTIERVSFATRANEDLRARRSVHAYQLECVLPILAIANYVLNRPCDLIKSALSHFDGDRPLKKVAASPAPVAAGLEWRLHSLTSVGSKNPYAGYAASIACKAPLQFAFSSRKPRGPETSDCVFMVMDVITPYLILNHYDFDRAHFDRIIQNVVNTGSSGLAGANSLAEQQLVSAVNAVQARTRENMARISRAFHDASRLNASTISFASTEVGTVDANSANDTLPPVPEPSTSGQATRAVGQFELNLADLTLERFRQLHPEVRPRIRAGNQWVQGNASFAVDVLPNPSPSQIAEVQSTLSQWYPSDSDSNSSSDSDSSDSSGPIAISNTPIGAGALLRSGRTIASSMSDELDERNPGTVIVIARYQNRPVSILMGNVNTDVREASIPYSVSNPDSLRTPYSNAAVRGGGQRTLQRFIEYNLERGIRLISTDAVTEVSAQVKRKFGFKHEDEL